MNEISVNVEVTNGVINFDNEKIKLQLSEELETYKNMVFTEDTKVKAKKTVASLRKLQKAINDRRIEIKKSFVKPYADFEAKVKELDALIEEPISFINTQVEEFERKRVQKRKELIRQIYNETISDVAEYLPIAKIYDSKWENASTTKKAITEDISKRVQAVHSDLDTIRSMESKYEDKAIERYKKSLELSDAIQCIRNYEKQEEEIRKRQEDEEKRKAERAEEAAQPVVEKPVETIPDFVQEAEQEIKEEFIEPEDDIAFVTYLIQADAFQTVQLESYMKEIGVSFRRA